MLLLLPSGIPKNQNSKIRAKRHLMPDEIAKITTYGKGKMPRDKKIVFRSARESREHLFKNWPADWPSQEHHVIQHDVTEDQYFKFSQLIQRRSSEREVERYFAENREVLSLVIWMFSTGHHMSWLFPKAHIRPTSGTAGGLIPDYLMAGASSEGIRWFLLELKGANARAFRKTGKRVYLSNEANKGLCQLLNYMDWSSRDQAYLRDGLELKGFREPRGILLIGTDDETRDPQIQSFKSAWNRFNSSVQIRSYSGLLRQLQAKLRH